jgi:uncharacterized protein YndB with AHSA1/START domain
MPVTAQAEATVNAEPDVVFAALTDVARLPQWNHRMTRVVEVPANLVPGAQWVVEFRVFGRSWRSRSTLGLLDTATRRFAYRSGTDDGNPSYAEWEWTVTKDPAGSQVRVSWTLHPMTFWRRTLLVRMRAAQLARTELPGSLAALAHLVTAEAWGPAVEPPA